MATLRTRWLLSIFLVSLPDCCAPAGHPAPPSPPECSIPCDERSCDVDIHCSWDPGLDPQIPTNYSLHWKPANRQEGNVTCGTSLSGVIHREYFSNHEKLHVWIKAENQHDSSTSKVVVFNTADIIKPHPPNITLRQQDPFEIEWRSFCGELQLSGGNCYIRNRMETDQVWTEHESGFLDSYTLDQPQPGTVYVFQVCCACSEGLTSDWSTEYRVRSAEQAPVGQLDIWRDCGISPASFDCVLTWKRLPISQACGQILGYEVRLFYSNDTQTLVNVSTAESHGQLCCNEEQCYLNFSLKDVASVNVSAFNALGTTVPSHVVMPIPGTNCPDCHKSNDKNEVILNLVMNEENLTISWDPPSQASNNIKEYVVQYKQAGHPPGLGFDWVKVAKNQTTVFFKGQFIYYTPFQVLLFALSHKEEVHHLSSVIGYSLEGPPSSVPSFQVLSIAATQVTLSWESVPLSRQKGVIQYYQIGLGKQNVHNVSASPQHKNWTFELNHLSPSQEYEVWIRAVTGAGPGENATVKFKTKQQEDYEYLIAALLGIFSVVIVLSSIVLVSSCRGVNKVCPLVPSFFYEKVPDPRNSHIFRRMKHQINDPLTWICIPTHEPHPKISILEVVEIPPGALQSLKKTSDPDKFTRPVMGDGCSQMNCQEDQREDAVTEDGCRTGRRYGKEEYSKMVDSDDERDREEDRGDCWSSSEEEQFTSGYEKHFMPSALEIQGV
ncbi:interleukin 12 receptor, beta 2a, like [Toxotes jaculatrix]|uniref:interleukin 12 receptor, beta 2a, like n=1 Tax=Toxotes jaculatrix TaxID=941984 RepID=UPI001B3AF123|nr:interleukin 12 receptor, beta 2a, like [Toxotes jaculatrix]